MIKEMTITETRKRITSLENEIGYDDTITITNHGREVFALMKWDTYESIAETLEILMDDELLKSLKTGIKQMQEDSMIDFDTFKQNL
ncbi:MAG: type II toxin-antitoxin system prevent-host-death family antitoxin [Spirochaetaceae bacterium]|nr:MAG: type II toxin-antitoxin system prevent-host-death family antitoxin [Spirochaetaceae bacterium]